MTSTADIRAYANLPAEVPETLLSAHLTMAVADVNRRIGLDADNSQVPPKVGNQTSAGYHKATTVARQSSAQQTGVSVSNLWQEAVTVRTLASVYPHLNTFALDGAAKVGRLEGEVSYRFLDAAEVDARVARFETRFNELIGLLTASDGSDNASVRTDTLTMMAV